MAVIYFMRYWQQFKFGNKKGTVILIYNLKKVLFLMSYNLLHAMLTGVWIWKQKKNNAHSDLWALRHTLWAVIYLTRYWEQFEFGNKKCTLIFFTVYIYRYRWIVNFVTINVMIHVYVRSQCHFFLLFLTSLLIFNI